MLKVKEVQAKSIITKSNLPDGDFVINPYTGCEHSCVYCYARFMKRFTGHNEPWGEFVDVKINASDLIFKNHTKYKNKSIVVGSVTDPYQDVEKKYKITRKILEKLVSFDSSFDIITKSKLIQRDVDLLKRFKDMKAVVSLAYADDDIRKKLEPNSSSVQERIETLRILNQNGIKTILFVSPIFPMLSDWKDLIKKTRNIVGEYWFENLNLYPSIKNNIFKFLKTNYSNLAEDYEKIYSSESVYWDEIEKEINDYCQKQGINYKIYFHHKKIRKKS